MIHYRLKTTGLSSRTRGKYDTIYLYNRILLSHNKDKGVGHVAQSIRRFPSWIWFPTSIDKRRENEAQIHAKMWMNPKNTMSGLER